MKDEKTLKRSETHMTVGKLPDELNYLSKDEKRENLLKLYEISMEHLRYMHGEVWNGVRFFITLNIGILGAVAAISKLSGLELARPNYGVILLFATGLLISVLGIFVLYRHRQYYLDMMVAKTVLEKLLGFMGKIRIGDGQHVLMLPWYYDEKTIENILREPYRFRRGFGYVVWPGTVTFALFVTYLVFIGLNVVGLWLSLKGLI